MEQLFNDLEQRYVSLKNEYDMVCVERDSIKLKHSSTKVSLDETVSSLESLQSDYSAKDAILHHRDAAIRDLEASQEELQSTCRKRQEEIDRMRDDAFQQSNQIVALQEKYQTCQTTLAEAEAREIPMQYENVRLKRENNNLTANMKSMEEDIAKRTMEMQNARDSYLSEISKLELSVATLTAECKSSDERHKHISDSYSNLEEKYKGSLGEVRDLKILLEEHKANSAAELDAGKRQLQLYTRYFEENTATISQLEEQIGELKDSYNAKVQVLKEKIANDHEVSSNELNTMKESYENCISDLRKEIASLQDSGTNHLRTVAVIDQDEPSAVASGALSIMEFQGLGVTEMYAKFVRTEKELAVERDRCSMLEHYLERVHKEVESRAPQIESQRRDYRRVLESHDKMAQRMDSVLAENETMKRRAEEATKNCGDIMENARSLEQQNKDLSTQIQQLLYNDFVKSHGPGIVEIPAGLRGAKSNGSANDVISEHLLTFNDVVEIQQKNCQLVQVIRKLSVDQEKAVARLEAIDKNGGVVPGSGGVSLETAMKEISDLKSSRQRMEDMVASLVQQRDVLRAMVEEAESSPKLLEAGSAIATPKGTPVHSRTPNASPVARQLETRLNEVR